MLQGMHQALTGMDWGFVARLSLAAILGGAIGFERDRKHRPAGIRTSMLICVGSAMFTLLSYKVAKAFGDTSGTRIVSNLVTGVGFLGAGAIIRDGATVVGLTTAATIFVMAAIGMAAGAGLYAIATFASAFVLIVLVIVGQLELRLGLRTHLMVFRLTVEDPSSAMKVAHGVFDQLKIAIQHFQVLNVGNEYVMEFETNVSIPQQRRAMMQLNQLDARCELVSITDAARRE
jgi:putative Mg2+ transporter-C (MgtC) family protein